MLNQNEIKTIVALICKEQNEIIRNNNYNSKEYLELEQLKIKVKTIDK